MAIFDVPGAYLQTEIPKEKRLLMKLRGQVVDIMCEVNEQYKEYIAYEKGNKYFIYKYCRHFAVASSPHYYGISCFPLHYRKWDTR